MAFLFMLAAECGQHRRSAELIVQHFESIRFELSDGNSIGFSHDPGAIWTRGDVIWCWAIPDGVSAGGLPQRVCTTAARVELTKLIHAELRLLKGFRFALVGWEAALGPDWNEIVKEVATPELLPPGLIIDDDLYRTLGCPNGFEPFGEGTWWRPVSDEVYTQIIAF
ncbi:MAG: hypothetical protein JNN07_25895 [Verrucomicrobiales bacterium]|nr:hypothetical protein [Verrucomicrobiales bacterium]